MLIDVVLGHGAEDDPAASLAPAIERHPATGGDHRRRHLPRPAGTRPPGRGAARGRVPRSTCPTPAPPDARSRSWEVHVMSRRTSSASASTCSPRPSPTRPPTSRRVDWRPPLPGTEDDLATVALDPLRADANARALERMLAVQARPGRRRSRPARRVGLERGEFLHAGPPITWDRASGPLRGALMGGAALEGLVDTTRGRARRSSRAALHVRLEPCHHRRAVGPDGRRRHAEHVDVRARGPRDRGAHPLHAQRGARQGPPLRRLLPRGARPAALDGRRARPAAAAGRPGRASRSTSPRSSARCCRWATRPTTATAPAP